MNIDDFKKEFQKRRAPRMDGTVYNSDMNNLILRIKKQDKEDEKYLLKNKIIPLFIGLLLFTMVIIAVPAVNIIVFLGCIFIFSSLLFVLILWLIDYKNISKESFDLNLQEFLKQKEERLKYWKSTHWKYYLILVMYLFGLILMLVGNEPFVRSFQEGYFTVFLVTIIFIIVLSHLIGERMYRRRHNKKHQPLLEIITEVKRELAEEE